MLKFETADGEIKLYIDGSFHDIVADTLVVLRAIYDNLDAKDGSDVVREAFKRQIVELLTHEDSPFFDIGTEDDDAFNEKDFDVGTKVIVTDGIGNKHSGTIVNVNNYREPDMKYAVDVGLDDVVFVGEGNIELADIEEATT